MKVNADVSSSRRKSRKAHLASDSNTRAKLMSARLSKDLAARHGVRSMPIRKDDKVKIVAGSKGGSTGFEGKVTAVYRKKFKIHVEGLTRTNSRERREVHVPVDPSNVVITSLKMDKNRKEKLDAKQAAKAGKTTGTAAVVDQMD